jgi:Aspartokinases
MVGVPGTAERLFRALASRGVNVILISQASSEHTIVLPSETPMRQQQLRPFDRNFDWNFTTN